MPGKVKLPTPKQRGNIPHDDWYRVKKKHNAKLLTVPLDALPAFMQFVRETEGCTQRELAHALGVHKVVPSQWERGLYRPQYEMLIRWAKVFGYDGVALTWETLPTYYRIKGNPSQKQRRRHEKQLKASKSGFDAMAGGIEDPYNILKLLMREEES